MSLEDRFNRAVYLVRNGPSRNSSNEEKLSFYKYYKQATEGDVKGSQPYSIQFEARAKWDAWKSVEGLSADEAKQKYIDLVASNDANWEQHETLKGYTA
ncbi:acyl-CoA-binding protein [Acrasis kona]|uniref:Acyl-CoA-binding protein n=1 Tax=Acrasis kona TaxID=1008807 RepID=A0AAW2YYR7_9EUKA